MWRIYVSIEKLVFTCKYREKCGGIIVYIIIYMECMGYYEQKPIGG